MVDAADGEPGTSGLALGDVLEEGDAGGGASGFGGGGPHRAGAEVVDSWFGGRGVGLRRGVLRPTRGRSPITCRATGTGMSCWPRWSTSAVGGECDVGAVVDGEQCSVPTAGVGHHLE